jgi:hypothetical protein
MPGFLGHVLEDGFSAVHAKHGIAAFLLGLACFGVAWFNVGPKKAARRLRPDRTDRTGSVSLKCGFAD